MNTGSQASQMSHRPTPYKVRQRDRGAESGTNHGSACGTTDLKSLALQVLSQGILGQVRDKARDTLSQPLKTPGTVSSGDSIPSLTKEEYQEVVGWPTPTQRVFTRLLDHFKGRGFPLIQAERLSFTTLMVLKQRKGWPLVLVQDPPPEIGRALGMVLDVFSGARLVNYGHKAGTAQ